MASGPSKLETARPWPLLAVMPRAAMDWIGRMLKGDQVLAHPDHAARAAYEARVAGTVQAPPEQAEPAERETETV